MKSRINCYDFSGIKGQSRAISAVVKFAAKYAATEESILIVGDSGTGKGLFAQSIHGESKRKNKPFMAVNCAVMPEKLLEKALFGDSEGSLTGTRIGGKPGLFELTEGGSLFLDEIGDMPLDIQAKVLWAIKEKKVWRVGSGKLVPVDVRIIAATHQNLLELCTAGKFREDLLYRLDVLRLNIPPLSERREDIPILTIEILNRVSDITPEQRGAIVASIALHSNYDWPGNVRELNNVVQILAVLTNGLGEFKSRAVAKEVLQRYCGATKAEKSMAT